MDNKEMEKTNEEKLEQATGGYTMGYDPRIMDCPYCGHHMLKRINVDDVYPSGSRRDRLLDNLVP